MFKKGNTRYMDGKGGRTVAGNGHDENVVKEVT